jgi:hypothetical protein
MPKEDADRIHDRCDKEAAKAVAGRPLSRSRDEQEEDYEFDCLKRNGFQFRL